jgi:BirA family biotin operon repressor/biotin-[acetyl-CoA-carboxylase] ligase
MSAQDDAPAPTPNPLSLICRFAEVPSTNTLCADLIRAFEGDLERLPMGLIFADRQTAGRGRGEHAWISPPGGLYFSVFFRAETVPPFLPLTTGLFLSRWIERETGLPVRVRWPNDLMLDERKLGGILCEAKGGACIIGVGLNVNVTVILDAGSLQPPTSLKGVLGRELDLADLRGEMISAVSTGFLPYILDARNLSTWGSFSAFAPGRPVRWKSGGRQGRGTYLGITAEGFLKVDSGGAVLELASAEDVAAL